MKTRILLIAMALSALCPAGEVSPFYLPIRNNDLAALRQLIRDPGPTARDARGNSPLMYAAALGSVESMRLLLDAGADPNIANNFDATPLMWCAGDAAKVRLLALERRESGRAFETRPHAAHDRRLQRWRHRSRSPIA